MSTFTERFTRLIAVAAAGFIALSVAALPAQAQEAPQYAPTMLILDASGSMQRPDPAGTMMDAAKNAVHNFVDAAPAESQVGLTVYGTGTGNTEADKAAGCRDVQVLRKPQTLDRSALTGAVDGIKASGWTPMGTSLRQAADALPKSGPRSIVLVSDGDDTCSPPEPCAVARELKQQGVDLVLHTIGFAVDATARAQLTCMAQATGGTYTDAADGPTLERTLPRVSAAALRNYRAAGIPITGTKTYDTAPKATPGQYLDTIGQKEKRYWAIDVPDGATAYFSGTVSFPRLSNISILSDLNSLELRVYGADGTDCNAREQEQESRSSDGVALTVAQSFDGATKKRAGSGRDGCHGGGTYYFALDWNHVSSGVPERLPIELLFGVEPGVSDPGPTAVAPPVAGTESTGLATPMPGGASFNVATTLTGSGRYTDTIQQGEYIFYRVKLDWGQGLAYRVRYEQNGGGGTDNIMNVGTDLYGPSRERILSDTGAYIGDSGEEMPGAYKRLATSPIRYNNRAADDSETRKQAVAGWYYIAVKVGLGGSKGDNRPVPVQLDLTVSGDKENGPSYSSAIGDGVFGEKATGTTTAETPSKDTPGTSAVAEPAESGSTSPVALIIILAMLGVAILAVVGVFLWWLAVRRPRR